MELTGGPSDGELRQLYLYLGQVTCGEYSLKDADPHEVTMTVTQVRQSFSISSASRQPSRAFEID
jgi:hypothetical protein